jgi:CBS domain-containing protein
VKYQLFSITFSGPLEIIPLLLIGNIVLAGFNLLPAFPMDGGRILRALLSIKLGRLKATKLASMLGNFFGILMVIYSVYTQSIFTGFIGVFIFLLASQEYRMVKMDEALKNHFLSEIFRPNFTRISAADKMGKAIEEMKHGLEKNFLVFDENEKVIGVLHELFILEAMKKKDFEGPVLEYMSRNFEELNPEISLQSLSYKMREKGYSILPVFEENQLKGVVDVSMLNNFLKIQQKVA